MATDIGPRIGITGESEFRSSINAINAQMKALGAEMKAVTAEFAASANSEEALTAKNEVLGKSVQAAKDKLATLDSQLDRQKGKLSELSAALDQAAAEFGENSAEAAKAQNAYNQQYNVVARLEQQYNTAREQLAGFENQMAGVEDASTAASQALSAQDVLAGVGAWSMLESGVRAATDAMQEAIGTGMEYDAEMSNLAATMGTTVDKLGQLREFSQDIGASTVFTATDAVQGLEYLALAGKNAQESMEMLPATMNLAAAGALDLGTATDMVTDAQSALQLSTERTNALVDEMALTATKTNTSVGQLGDAILTVGGTAKFLAGGTKELNQVLGILADNSIKGTEGGTKLRNIILSLSAPTEKAAKVLDDMGVAVFDAEGNFREFSDIFPELQKALSRLTDQQQIDALSEIFNNRDIAAAQALLGTTAERWDELSVAIDGAAGSAEKMAETRLDNLAGDITLLQSAADGAKIAFSDSLTPALRDVTQAGTGILSFVGDAVSEFPILGQATAGLITGIGAITLGMTAMSAASALGITSIGALTSAILASPVAPFAVGIGAVVTVLGLVASEAEHAGEKITEAGQAVADSRKAWEEQKAAVNTQRESIEDLANQFEELAGKENRTSGEKAQLLAITQELNEAVPELGLNYDQLNDTLNMTTEQVLALARAEADAQERADLAAKVVEAERNQAAAVRELEQAERDLAAAQENLSKGIQDGLSVLDQAEYERLGSEVQKAQVAAEELTAAVADSQAQVEEMSARLEEVAESSETATVWLDEAADAAEQTGVSAEKLAVDLEALKKATKESAESADTLSTAMKEQEKSGSLSLKTTDALIEEGYAAALAIDTETGAVTLNREEYVRLASAKIQAQIAALEAEKQAYDAAQATYQEATAARNATSAYWEMAAAKAAQKLADRDGLASIDTQIAALKRAQASMESYGSATTATAAKSTAASRKVKTQAEEDLDAYKTLKAELDHQRAMDLVDEAEYYRQLETLRDQFLTDDANVSEYRKASETIYKADRQALANREKLWQTAGDNILKLEEDFQKELATRAGQIAGSYKLFDEVPERQKADGEELIANLEDQISSIDSFYSNLQALSDRGVGGSLVDEIRAMGVSAAGELEGLLELTDEQLTKYSELYAEKQELANKIALEELDGLRASTNEKILDQLGDVADLYDTNAPALGLAFAESLAQGMFEGMPIVESMAQAVANSAMAAFESTYNRDVEALMTASGSRSVTRNDLGELLAGAVNGINAGSGASAAQPLSIVIQTRDKIEIARAFLPDIRAADAESPQVQDDT